MLIQLPELAISLGVNFHFEKLDQLALGASPDFGVNQLVLGSVASERDFGEVAGVSTTRGDSGLMVLFMGVVLVTMYLLLFRQLFGQKLLVIADKKNEGTVQE